MIQFLIFDTQSNSFKRDYYIEEFLNDYNAWWERGL